MCGTGRTGDAPHWLVSCPEWHVILTSHLSHESHEHPALFCLTASAKLVCHCIIDICNVCSATAPQPGQCAQQLVAALVYIVCVQCCHALLCHDSSVVLQRAIHCIRVGPGLRQCLETSPGQCSVLCWMHSRRHYVCSLVTASRYAPLCLHWRLQQSLATQKIASLHMTAGTV